MTATQARRFIAASYADPAGYEAYVTKLKLLGHPPATEMLDAHRHLQQAHPACAAQLDAQRWPLRCATCTCGSKIAAANPVTPMNAVLDQLALTTLTPRVNDEARRGPTLSARGERSFAALEPQPEDEAGLDVALCLTANDIERLAAFSQHVATRREALCDAENALAHATHQSKRLSVLERRAGVLAADAIRGGRDAKKAAATVPEEIEDARAAAGAIKELTHARDAAATAFAQARGALRGAATASILQMMLRARATGLKRSQVHCDGSHQRRPSRHTLIADEAPPSELVRKPSSSTK
jgi:hypothetical protein